MTPLFVPKSDHRIDLGGAAGWEVTGSSGDAEEDCQGDKKGGDRGVQAEEHGGYQAIGGKRER